MAIQANDLACAWARPLELMLRGPKQEVGMPRLARAFLSYLCRHRFRDSQNRPGMQVCRHCGRTRLIAVCGA